MLRAIRSMVLGLILAGALPSAGVFAAEAAETVKPLPTLLIKGEIVSVDSSDAAAILIKVKDRYGFETPIYLKSEAKITQADAAASTSALTSGSNVEVEYNFDVNTAKRHAVSVKIAPPKAEAVEAAPAAPAEAAVETPTAAAPAADAAVEPAPAAATTAVESAAPAAVEAPAADAAANSGEPAVEPPAGEASQPQ